MEKLFETICMPAGYNDYNVSKLQIDDWEAFDMRKIGCMVSVGISVILVLFVYLSLLESPSYRQIYDNVRPGTDVYAIKTQFDSINPKSTLISVPLKRLPLNSTRAFSTQSKDQSLVVWTETMWHYTFFFDNSGKVIKKQRWID